MALTEALQLDRYTGRRLSQHTLARSHAFLNIVVSTIFLNVDERSVIKALERVEFHLRNIAFTSYPEGESNIDQIMSVEDETRKPTSDLLKSLMPRLSP